MFYVDFGGTEGKMAVPLRNPQHKHNKNTKLHAQKIHEFKQTAKNNNNAYRLTIN